VVVNLRIRGPASAVEPVLPVGLFEASLRGLCSKHSLAAHIKLQAV